MTADTQLYSKKKAKKKKKKWSYHWIDKHILIVEDIEVNHMLIDRILQRTSATLYWAMDGLQAVQMCQDNNKLDCVLMDIRLPKMNGFDATREIRKINPELPIIAQTAYVMEDEIDKVLEVGCNDLITKPIDKDLLLKKVNKYIDWREK